MPEFYMIFARKNNKMPEFYMIFTRKIFSRIWGGGQVPPAPSPVSYAYGPYIHRVWHRWVKLGQVGSRFFLMQCVGSGPIDWVRLNDSCNMLS